jgi:antitoxin CptB
VSELGRVRWQCRRGMLELDLVLSRFLERHFADLQPLERAAFKGLLELSDNDLWDVVSGRLHPETPTAAGVARLLREI